MKCAEIVVVKEDCSRKKYLRVYHCIHQVLYPSSSIVTHEDSKKAFGCYGIYDGLLWYL